MYKRYLLALCLVVFCFCITNSTVLAHDYWIIPSTFYPHENSLVKIAFSCGHTYFGTVETPDITKYRLNLITPDGQRIPLAYSKVEPKAAWSIVPIFGQGIYIIGTESITPSYWTKTTEGWVPEPKNRAKNVLQGGKYFKSVKTFLRVGKGSDSYKIILGYRIEIVPQKDPTTLKPGQSIPLLVLYNGKPIKNVSVFGIYEGYKPLEKNTYPVETKTNRNGIAYIRLTKPGQWLIGARYQFDTPRNSDADYENYRAYMMLEVKK